VTYNSVETEITIGAGTSSLQDVVDAINDQVEGVQAYIMDTGDPADPDGQYRIVLGGESTGATHAISLDTSGLTAGPGVVPTFETKVPAQDAILTVNGVTVSHADNDVEGVIEGVTFHVQEQTASAISVNVSRDVDAMVEKIGAFVSAYNNVVGHIRTQTAYNPDENIKGAFVGESTHRAVQQSLQSVVASAYPASASMTALSGMGFATLQNGSLELDEEELRAALAANYDGCVKLFTASTGVNEALRNKLEDLTDSEGIVNSRVEALDKAIEAQDARLDRLSSRLSGYEARLKKQFAAMEVSMARFQSAGNSLLALMPQQSSSDG
jgi:flagellar hook-associated protein 2